MGNKNKTVSFRVNEETFESLREIAEEHDLSLSAVFRDYVDTFVANEGQVQVISEDTLDDPDADFPPRVEVPKDFIRDHERLELEKEYLELEACVDEQADRADELLDELLATGGDARLFHGLLRGYAGTAN